MSEQPEALRLADVLEDIFIPVIVDRQQAAAELRRLHEENQKLQQQLGESVWNYGEKVRANQELLEALKTVMGDANHGQNMTWAQRCSQARAAITKGEQA